MPAVSKAQQRFMGMVHATQKGDIKAPSKAVSDAAGEMSDRSAEDFAKTKRKGLPEHHEKKSGIQGLEKAAAAASTIQLQNQSYMPIISHRRKLSPAEESEAASESSKLIPRIFTSKADSPFVDMANPIGQAGLYGAAGAGIGGVIGNALAGRQNGGTGALLGALLLGLPAGVAGYMGRNASNESIKEQVRNLPRGATRRTLESDPVYQKELDRQNALIAAVAQSTGRVTRRF